MKDILIQVKNLSTAFREEGRVTQILYDVNFNIYKGEVLGIVGESGSGKSVTSKTLMRLIPEPPAQILGGEVLFEGDPNQNVLKYTENQMCSFRGEKVAMIFQEPMTSLNRCSPAATRSARHCCSTRRLPKRRPSAAPSTC